MRRFRSGNAWAGPEVQTVLDFIDRQHLAELGFTQDLSELDCYTAYKFLVVSQAYNEKEKKPGAKG